MIIVDQLLTHSCITTISRLVRLTEQTINPTQLRVRFWWLRDGGLKSKDLMRFSGKSFIDRDIFQSSKFSLYQYFMEKGITGITENTWHLKCCVLRKKRLKTLFKSISVSFVKENLSTFLLLNLIISTLFQRFSSSCQFSLLVSAALSQTSTESTVTSQPERIREITKEYFGNIGLVITLWKLRKWWFDRRMTGSANPQMKTWTNLGTTRVNSEIL